MIDESSMSQYAMEQGMILGMQRGLLMSGTAKFGPPDDTNRYRLTGVTDLERLGRMAESVLFVNTWQEVMATM